MRRDEKETSDKEEHDHCQGCECILKCNEGENYCCWCEERMAKEKGTA